MPKCARKPPTLIAWVALAGFACWLTYVLWQYPFVSGACVATFAALSWLNQRSIRNHLHALAASRTSESICTFARAVDCRSLDTWIVRAVYEEIQAHLPSDCAKFPIRWEDRLKEDLRIDPDELDEELAIDIAERTGRDLAGAETNPLFGKVKTVGDLALFFHAQRRRCGVMG
jgi:hypothetical protein